MSCRVDLATSFHIIIWSSSFKCMHCTCSRLVIKGDFAPYPRILSPPQWRIQTGFHSFCGNPLLADLKHKRFIDQLLMLLNFVVATYELKTSLVATVLHCDNNLKLFQYSLIQITTIISCGHADIVVFSAIASCGCVNANSMHNSCMNIE